MTVMVRGIAVGALEKKKRLDELKKKRRIETVQRPGFFRLARILRRALETRGDSDSRERQPVLTDVCTRAVSPDIPDRSRNIERQPPVLTDVKKSKISNDDNNDKESMENCGLCCTSGPQKENQRKQKDG